MSWLTVKPSLLYFTLSCWRREKEMYTFFWERVEIVKKDRIWEDKERWRTHTHTHTHIQTHTFIYIYIYIYSVLSSKSLSKYVQLTIANCFLSFQDLFLCLGQSDEATNNIKPLRTTSKMVESTWSSMESFLHHLDPDIRKITKRLERHHLKILKRRQSAIIKQTCLYIKKNMYGSFLINTNRNAG